MDKGVPFNPRKKATEEVRVKVDFAEGDFNVCELEREIVGGAALCVARKEVMGDQTDHRSWRRKRGTVRSVIGPCDLLPFLYCRGRGLPTGCLMQRLHTMRFRHPKIIWVFV